MRKLFCFDAGLMGITPSAYAATLAYTLDAGGDGIQLNQTGEEAGGFTFSKGCSNEMFVGGFKASSKLGKKTWAISVPSGTATGASAVFLDEQKLTWTLYYADSAYQLPWSEINAGTLTVTKPCGG